MPISLASAPTSVSVRMAHSLTVPFSAVADAWKKSMNGMTTAPALAASRKRNRGSSLNSSRLEEMSPRAKRDPAYEIIRTAEMATSAFWIETNLLLLMIRMCAT